jgi:hypothetical protein
MVWMTVCIRINSHSSERHPNSPFLPGWPLADGAVHERVVAEWMIRQKPIISRAWIRSIPDDIRILSNMNSKIEMARSAAASGTGIPLSGPAGG